MAIVVQKGRIGQAAALAQAAGEGRRQQIEFAQGQQLVDSALRQKQLTVQTEAADRAFGLDKARITSAIKAQREQALRAERTDKFQQTLAVEQAKQIAAQNRFNQELGVANLELKRDQFVEQINRSRESARAAQDKLLIAKRDADRKAATEAGKEARFRTADLQTLANSLRQELKLEADFATGNPERAAEIRGTLRELDKELYSRTTAEMQQRKAAGERRAAIDSEVVNVVDSAFEKVLGTNSSVSPSSEQADEMAGLISVGLESLGVPRGVWPAPEPVKQGIIQVLLLDRLADRTPEGRLDRTSERTRLAERIFDGFLEQAGFAPDDGELSEQDLLDMLGG